MQIETVTTDRFSMDYCRFGHGDGTLVILPGLSVQSVMPSAGAIAEQDRLLTDDFTVYVFDRRKGVLPGTYTIQDMADDTAEVLRELGLDRVDIFGASQGGMLAMEMAIRHPESVHKLILGSTAACIHEEQMKSIDEWIELAAAGKTQELYLSFGRMVYPEEVFEGLKTPLSTAAKTVTDGELARFVVLAEAMRGFDITDDLKRITCPVLVIGSEDDGVLGGEASGQIAKGLSNSADCELYMYEGYGHAAYDCAPDYQERMLNFLMSDQSG